MDNCSLSNNTKTSNCDVVENLFGVYLLYCLNPKYKGRTYIGYTVNPNRRIGQHNKGEKSGGARRTSNRGPWEMVLIVHGFPNDISALRFEWAWQNPKRSRRLRQFARKSAGEKAYDYCIRILLNMLRIGPWNRLPLTIRWLAVEFQREFLADRCPPMHMPIAYGPVITKKVSEDKLVESNQVQTSVLHVTADVCVLCHQNIKEYALSCLKHDCQTMFHVICLAKQFCGSVDNEQIIPITGNCPACDTFLLWGDLVRNKIVISNRLELNNCSLDQSG